MLEPPPPFCEKGGNTPENHFPRFEPTAHPPGPRRIYFTTKQKISERLGLRCLGLLAPRLVAWRRGKWRSVHGKVFCVCVGNN